MAISYIITYENGKISGLDIVSMAGEWLAATANANMFTYEAGGDLILALNGTVAWDFLV